MSDKARFADEAVTEEMVDMIVEAAGNTIFSVLFRKRSNPDELRHMHCRFGVRKGLTGVGASYDPVENGLMVVYDVDKRGYRSIPLEGIEQITIRGKTFWALRP